MARSLAAARRKALAQSVSTRMQHVASVGANPALRHTDPAHIGESRKISKGKRPSADKGGSSTGGTYSPWRTTQMSYKTAATIDSKWSQTVQNQHA